MREEFDGKCIACGTESGVSVLCQSCRKRVELRNDFRVQFKRNGIGGLARIQSLAGWDCGFKAGWLARGKQGGQEIVKKCVSCGVETDYCCADCMIDKKEKVYVCGRTECRDKHEENGCTRVGI